MLTCAVGVFNRSRSINFTSVPMPSRARSLGGMVEFTPTIGTGGTPNEGGGFGIVLTPRLTFKASVPVGNRRPWQRTWRDVQHDYGALAAAYQRKGVNDDDFTRRIEVFFKTCRELADWIHRQHPGLDAMDYVNTESALKICDALAQTAKHHTRYKGITAKVEELFLEANGARADIAWTDGSSSGTLDALKLADDCIAEWKAFFQQHGLDPAG
jgi:hypothetical protein